METLIVKCIALIGGSFALGYGSKNIRLAIQEKFSDFKTLVDDVKKVRKAKDAE